MVNNVGSVCVFVCPRSVLHSEPELDSITHIQLNTYFFLLIFDVTEAKRKLCHNRPRVIDWVSEWVSVAWSFSITKIHIQLVIY